MKRPRVASLAALLLAAAWSGGCREDAPPPEAAERSYCDRSERFALDVPEGWDPVRLDGVDAAFMRRGSGSAARLVVTVEVRRPGRTVDNAEGLLTLAREQLSQFDGYEELETGLADHESGRRAYRVDALCRHPPATAPSGETSVRRFRQYGMLVRGRWGAATALGPADSAGQWLPKTEPLLQSFLLW